MRYCAELVLSGQSSFEFACALLENWVENIQQTGGSDQVIAHQVLVEQLGTYSRDFRNQEKVNPVADAQRVSENLRANQKCECKKIEGRIAVEAHYLDDSKASYQNFKVDLQRSEIVTKGAEGVIAIAWAAIAKAQVLIHDNELKVTNEKKRNQELKATKSQVQ